MRWRDGLALSARSAIVRMNVQKIKIPQARWVVVFGGVLCSQEPGRGRRGVRPAVRAWAGDVRLRRGELGRRG